VEQRRRKEKTRPRQEGLYAIGRHEDERPAEPAELATQTSEVNTSSMAVFETLFSKSQARGSINWTAFTAAMTDLGFSVVPKGGSIYTFSPPESMNVRKSLTVHRPHHSRIEGNLILNIAKRLKRSYSWSFETFQQST
jgi:hypothetical protein